MSNSNEAGCLRKQLDDLKKNIEAERQMGRDFISSVSHELRTPVAVLRGSLEALCDGVIYEPSQVNEYHRQMLSESIYLQRLVNDLLEYSRLQSDGFEINKSPVNVFDITDDVSRSMRKLAIYKQIELTYQKPAEGFFINGDYTRIRQMFIVVLDNAIKFTPAGGKVGICAETADGKLKIDITDNGCGIPEDELENIFIKFHRSVSDKNKNGSGLGLAIARKIADRHDIQINVRSQVGNGTDFCFIFNKSIDKAEICGIID